MQKIRTALALSIATLVGGFLLGACEDGGGTNTTTGGLKIGSLLPTTGDLASIGQQMAPSVPLLVETVNACGGVNGQPVTLVAVDDQTDPKAGAAGMTKLASVDKVAGVVGSFASSVSTAAVSIAAQNQVMLISPGSTSPVFTEKAQKGDFKGFWARTVPPDSYQGPALAQLATKKGFKRVSTVVINNDYGVGFEKAFVQAFEKLGGTVVNKKNPVRYDPKATTFETEATAAFAGKPDAVLGVFYVETGSLLLKSAYQQGLSKGVQVMLTDGMKSDEFPGQVGKGSDGKYIATGTIGTVPGSDGKALESFQKLWKEKKGGSPGEFAPQAWDAAALLVLSAQAAKENTGAGIAKHIREVAGGPGTEVTDVCEGLKLLQKGEKINYQGASGNVDVDVNGDVVGVYDVWTVGDDGKIKVIDKVTPKK
ncbi:amino acid ABC transporter substrate-binding protein [Nostoc linckia z18]|uniref:Amino acid ABC transporter substrate-binding protein n=2 Tax=Nostoc linckia TaxID=92942 RepID=A0A9Q5ZCM1_NOSLI|nr:ABC transporter substrate-binding protein [Nostoc linckia]PHK30341.1 amino acid ABC transporter substrate-binding protein [Nostoc linckia z15]PHK45312.1 amino acid ABC transporter substrate-binding protein [Nostoc linckia z16]PHJ60802.1 amino acid ABC transporter substrate-binding protein [Nostoc linckia z1]PHJ68107.1 amino acid ABC transporter substrate-binding protein [Nostoc linckia z2]PHJ71732.1 amino acid ABC transporter substrate-binding protein [Nostoc linckia z3]